MKLYRKKSGYTDEITTTVGELVAELLKLDQSALVFTEGCDCIGNVVSIHQESDGSILIERDDRMTEGFGEDRKLVVKYVGRVEDIERPPQTAKHELLKGYRNERIQTD